MSHMSTVKVFVAFLAGSNMYPVIIIVYNPIFPVSDVETEKTLVAGVKENTVASSAVPSPYVAE